MAANSRTPSVFAMRLERRLDTDVDTRVAALSVDSRINLLRDVIDEDMDLVDVMIAKPVDVTDFLMLKVET